MRTKPVVVAIHLDRPYVIPEIARESAALLATFGASDEAVLDVVTGSFAPTGKLPFELPSSMDAVRAQKEDVAFDSAQPLFPFGAGLTYGPAKKAAGSADGGAGGNRLASRFSRLSSAKTHDGLSRLLDESQPREIAAHRRSGRHPKPHLEGRHERLLQGRRDRPRQASSGDGGRLVGLRKLYEAAMLESLPS